MAAGGIFAAAATPAISTDVPSHVGKDCGAPSTGWENTGRQRDASEATRRVVVVSARAGPVATDCPLQILPATRRTAPLSSDGQPADQLNPAAAPWRGSQLQSGKCFSCPAGREVHRAAGGADLPAVVRHRRSARSGIWGFTCNAVDFPRPPNMNYVSESAREGAPVGGCHG